MEGKAKIKCSCA